MSNESYNTIAIILAVGTLLQPILVAGIFFTMFKFFPTRNEYNAREQVQEARHDENRTRFGVIEGDIKTLLERN
jgi:hypothetical protein